ncbi:hypothetical protein HYC85_012006 [Camellia sinensis]|uniref:Uncharacterized protein n=1 Tax=Camellia sinensis TaxID=4442 RepID=A0A7J7HAP4_CAMSI|nr:hypothetical protein HYC85_012006 [Camellia sinensis]
MLTSLLLFPCLICCSQIFFSSIKEKDLKLLERETLNLKSRGPLKRGNGRSNGDSILHVPNQGARSSERVVARATRHNKSPRSSVECKASGHGFETEDPQICAASVSEIYQDMDSK